MTERDCSVADKLPLTVKPMIAKDAAQSGSHEENLVPWKVNDRINNYAV